MVEMDLVYSPHDMAKILQQPVSWDANRDSAVNLAEYISTRLPQVVTALDYIRTENPVRGIEELTNEEQRKLTLAFLEHGVPKNWALARGDRTYSYKEIVDSVRKNTGFGPEYVRITIQGMRLFLGLVDAGKLRINPDKPDIGNLPLKLPEFPF